jgi:hypothetical protein
MASSNSDRPRRYGHRMLWLIAAIVIAIVGYVGAWHYVAGRVQAETEATIAELNREGRRANCENPLVRGFPFRIGVFCRSVLYEDARAGIGFRARELRSAAQVYAPRQVVAELDGPALVEFPGINALDVDWDELRASARLAEPLPSLLSVAAQGVRAGPDTGPNQSPTFVSMETGEFHMRPNGPDLDLAVRFSGLIADPELTGGRALPPLRGLADLSVDGAADAIPSRLRGLSGQLRTLSLNLTGEEGARLSGPFEIGRDGLIDARLEVTVRNPRALSATLGEIFPEARDQIATALSGLAALGDEPTLPLTITRGNARLGFLSLGQIPPVE